MVFYEFFEGFSRISHLLMKMYPFTSKLTSECSFLLNLLYDLVSMHALLHSSIFDSESSIHSSSSQTDLFQSILNVPLPSDTPLPQSLSKSVLYSGSFPLPLVDPSVSSEAIDQSWGWLTYFSWFWWVSSWNEVEFLWWVGISFCFERIVERVLFEVVRIEGVVREEDDVWLISFWIKWA